MNDDTPRTYRVKDPAVFFCGGERVAEDRTVRLTEAQAKYLLQNGEIEPAESEPAARRKRSEG